jgi:hypothetical protein
MEWTWKQIAVTVVIVVIVIIVVEQVKKAGFNPGGLLG